MGIEEIKSLCVKYGIRPSKSLGQNFLVDANVVRMMIESANLDANDFVVEVGPAFGTLTKEIAQRVKGVIAVELDWRLARAAQEILAPYKNVEVAEGDILKIPNSKFPIPNEGYKVVASLPYSITSAVLRKFTEQEPRPELCVFLVQKEVAERVCAKPGEMSVLSVAVQYYGHPEIVAVVPRDAFWPVPEVESAILKIHVSRITYHISREEEKRLFQIVRIGFSSRRKQLQNNLSAGLRLPREKVLEALRAVGLSPTVRAQDLAVQDWIALTREI